MGCPPDPVEVSIWRSGERIALLQERYDRFRQEYADAAELAEAMEIHLVEEPRAWPAEAFTTRTDVQPTEYNQYADQEAQTKLESGYAKKMKSLETALCRLRTALLCGLREKRGAGRPDSTLIKRVRRAHEAHRREDRAQAISWLRQQREVMQYYIEHAEQPARINRAAAVKSIAAIDSEILRLRSLTVSAMVYDRGLTELDEKRFRVPYK